MSSVSPILSIHSNSWRPDTPLSPPKVDLHGTGEEKSNEDTKFALVKRQYETRINDLESKLREEVANSNALKAQLAEFKQVQSNVEERMSKQKISNALVFFTLKLCITQSIIGIVERASVKEYDIPAVIVMIGTSIVGLTTLWFNASF